MLRGTERIQYYEQKRNGTPCRPCGCRGVGCRSPSLASSDEAVQVPRLVTLSEIRELPAK